MCPAASRAPAARRPTCSRGRSGPATRSSSGRPLGRRGIRPLERVGQQWRWSMRDQYTRVLLAIMAIGYVGVGAWAALAPRSFYDNFPGGGHHWVSADGPFNEHLVRDVGTLNLALAVVAGIAAFTVVPLLVRVAASALLVNAVPHLAYHLAHLGPYGTADRLGNVVSLSLAVVVPAAVLVAVRATHSASISNGMRR